MASAFLHKLLHSLGSGRYSSLPLLGGVASCKVCQVANLLFGLVHHSGNCTGCHCQGVLHGMGSSCRRAAMARWGDSWGRGLGSGHQGCYWKLCLQGGGRGQGGCQGCSHRGWGSGKQDRVHRQWLVETGQPGVVVSPIWTWNLRGRGGATNGLRFRAAGWASSHISTVSRIFSEEKYRCKGRCR